MGEPVFKCAWCGRNFTKRGIFGGTTEGAFFNKIGLKKDYCSNECKNAANAAAGGGNVPSSGGGTVVVNKGPSAAAEFAKGLFSGQTEASQQMHDAARDEKATRESAMQQIATMQFNSNADDIQNQLSSLVAMYEQYKPKFEIKPMGLDRGPSDKAIRSAIKEKLEFGIMKLNSSGKSAEAAYFQNKLEKIK